MQRERFYGQKLPATIKTIIDVLLRTRLEKKWVFRTALLKVN